MGNCLGLRQASERKTRNLSAESESSVVTSVEGRHTKKYRQAIDAAHLSFNAARGLAEVRPEVTPMDLKIVAESWEALRDNMVKVIQMTLYDLIVSVPMVQTFFLCYDMDAEPCVSLDSHLWELALKYAERAFKSMDKAMRLVDDEKTRILFFHELGHIHAVADVRVELLDLFLPSFIRAVQPALDESHVSSFEDAWAAFLQHAVYLMKETMMF